MAFRVLGTYSKEDHGIPFFFFFFLSLPWEVKLLSFTCSLTWCAALPQEWKWLSTVDHNLKIFHLHKPITSLTCYSHWKMINLRRPEISQHRQLKCLLMGRGLLLTHSDSGTTEILFKMQTLGHAWWYRPVIPATWELRCKDHSSRLAWATALVRLTQNKNNKTKYLPVINH